MYKTTHIPKVVGLFREHRVRNNLKLESKSSIIENLSPTLLCNPPVSPLQLTHKVSNSKTTVENVYIILTNNVPVGFTLNETDAKDYILKFSYSLMQTTCKINKINDSTIEVVSSGYLRDSVNYTVRYDKISRLI